MAATCPDLPGAGMNFTTVYMQYASMWVTFSTSEQHRPMTGQRHRLANLAVTNSRSLVISDVIVELHSTFFIGWVNDTMLV